MSLSHLNAELRAKIARFPTLPFRTRIGLWGVRQLSKVAPPSHLTKQVQCLKAKDAPRQTILYKPKTAPNGLTPAVMLIHGGGLIMGGPANAIPSACALALGLGALVISPSYRLSPEHPYPAALDDCMAVWLWMINNAEALNIDPSRCIVAGHSAGGGLAAALTQRLYDEGGPMPIAQGLFYPMLDDRTALKTSLKGVHLVWENGINRFAWESYLAPLTPGAEEVANYAAPGRRGNLSGLPPAWIGVGDHDLFWEEDLNYAQALSEAGVQCQLEKVSGAPHGFDLIVPHAKISTAFTNSLIEFLEQQLSQ